MKRSLKEIAVFFGGGAIVELVWGHTVDESLFRFFSGG